MNEFFKSSKEVIESQKKLMFPCMPKYRQPVVIVEGRGALVKDLDGKLYIDLFAGYAAVNIGHCHPKVVEAITYWAKRIHHTSYDYYNLPSALLAEKLVKILPMEGDKKVFFCVSGAEAIEGSIKLMKKYMLKNKGKTGIEVLTLRYSFHGRTHMATALTGQSKYKKGMATVSTIPGVKIVPAPYCYRCPFKMEYPECNLFCAYYIEDIIRFETSTDIGAFLAEPVLGEGGIIVPPKEYFKEVVKIIRDYDGLFIADEVQTGFARTGKIFGIENFEVEPDIIAMAKGITSGLPLGAIGAKAEIANAFESGDHSSTWGPNAVSCAAASAVIDVILKENIPEKVDELGKYFISGIEELAKKHRLIGDVRGLGLMIGVELVRDRAEKTPAVKEAIKVRNYMRESGFLIGAGGAFGSTLRIEPPLMITKEQIDRALEALDQALKKVE
ncbi:MAG: aspartate aminotransferase family protein [archaeon GB-1867-005]|nr:aspartate aminotransferase family protein [Candidatus Culexmicrobium cathedralense]